MPRASTVIKLVLLGSALGLVGWGAWYFWDDIWDTSTSRGYRYTSRGGVYHGSGGYSGRSAAQSFTSRGGFGGHGSVGAGT
jgi:hypothetical protein